MKVNYLKLFSYFLLLILLVFYFKKISSRYENFYSPPKKIKAYGGVYARLAKDQENIQDESDAIKYVQKKIDKAITDTIKKINDANNENINQQINVIDQQQKIDKAIHLISYQDSLFKIDLDFKIYQCYFYNGNWFYLYENYDNQKAIDLCIIKDQDKDYLYVLFENVLCRRLLNDYKDQWEVLNEDKLYSNNFNKLSSLTNNNNTLFFLANKSNKDNINNVDQDENQISKNDLFKLNINGIYQYSFKNPKMTLWNDKRGDFLKKPDINTATVNNIGVLPAKKIEDAVNEASSRCSNNNFFRIQIVNNTFIGSCSNDFKLMSDYDFCINNNCNIFNTSYIYQRRKTNVQPMLLSNNFKLIRFNNESDNDEFYGLYQEDSKVIVVKKNSLKVDPSTPYDDKFLFGGDDFQFLDLYLTNNYLYGLGIDGFIYRKLISVDVFGKESIVWNKVTSRCPNYTSFLKNISEYTKRITIINNFVFCIDGQVVKKHYLENGYEWINIDNINYANNYYPTAPAKMIQSINERTTKNRSIVNQEIIDDEIVNFSLLNNNNPNLINPNDDITQDFNLSQAFYEKLD